MDKSPRLVGLAHMNDDDTLDIVVVHDVSSQTKSGSSSATDSESSASVSILFGKEGANFLDGTGFDLKVPGPEALALADLNDDGAVDIITAHPNTDTVSIVLANGDGDFQSASQLNAGDAPSSVVTGDFNGDEVIDIVTANDKSNDISVFLGKGEGTFEDPQNVAVGGESPHAAKGDLNRNGFLLDLITANSKTDNVSLLMN